MNALFKVGGKYFARAVDEVLKDTITYSNVVDVKVATVFATGDTSSIVLIESGVFEDNRINTLINNELDSIADNRVTVFFCCCLSNDVWTAVNTCTSKRIAHTNTFHNENIETNPSYSTYLMEGLLNLTGIPDDIHTDSSLRKILLDIQLHLKKPIYSDHIKSVYQSYTDAVFAATPYLKSLLISIGPKPAAPTLLPLQGLSRRNLHQAKVDNKLAMDQYNDALSVYNKARVQLEKQLRMQHTLRSFNGLLAFVYYPWEGCADGIDRDALKNELRKNEEFETELAKLLSLLSTELNTPKVQENMDYLVKCMHCAEDNFLHTVTDAQVEQIKAAEKVVMFSILLSKQKDKDGNEIDENDEQRISPPCVFCQSHFRTEVKAMFGCSDYATYHVADVGDGTPEILVRQPQIESMLYQLKNKKFEQVTKTSVSKLKYK